MGSGVVDFGATQYFDEGTEDLVLDVTKIVSATLTNQISNHGFRIAFSGSEETDSKTRFVKRFGSRHARNEYIRPKLLIEYDGTEDIARQTPKSIAEKIGLSEKVSGEIIALALSLSSTT